MKLRSKLLLGQAPLAIALAVVGLIATWTNSRLGAHSQMILRDNYRSVLAVQQMKDSIERIDSAALFMLAGKPEKAREQTSRHLPRFEAELKVAEGNITEPDERVAAQTLRAEWERYRTRFMRYQQLEDEQKMRRDYFAELEPVFWRVKEAADTILAMNQDAMLQKSERVRAYAQQVSAIMLSTAIAALLLGLLASTVLTSRLLRPLSILSQAAHRIGEGDLQVRAVVPGEDEIARLAAEFNGMADRLNTYQRSSLGQLLQAQFASQAAIDSIPDPVIIFNVDGKVLSVNRAAESLLGLSFDAGGADPLTRADQTIRSTLEQVRAFVLGGKGPYVPKGFEEAVRTPSAEGERYYLPRAEPVYGEHEGIAGATVIMQDVTRLRRFDQLKNDLVATVAHEFRTPLTSLRMAIHLCLEEMAGPVTEKQTELLAAAREDCERLQSIVDDLLDLARIQSGRIEMHPRTETVEGLVDGVVESFRTVAAERHIELRAEVPALIEDVEADPERIRIVFSNLLTNAIRHTPAGGQVRVSAHRQGGHIRLEVSDSGEGIPIAHQRAIFDRFYRIPGTRSGGAGLGLSIAQEIVRAHRGEIGVESVPGQGSTFWFTLPIAGRSAAGDGVS